MIELNYFEGCVALYPQLHFLTSIPYILVRRIMLIDVDSGPVLGSMIRARSFTQFCTYYRTWVHDQAVNGRYRRAISSAAFVPTFSAASLFVVRGLGLIRYPEYGTKADPAGKAARAGFNRREGTLY